MFCYTIEIEFDGTAYEGWQIQPAPHKTVQAQLNSALSVIFKSDDIKTIGSGRTDQGVHAQSFSALAKNLPYQIEPASLKKALNSKLPLDIRVRTINATEQYNPTKDAKSRSYFYLVTARKELGAIESRYIVSYGREFCLKKIQEAANLFLGEHDFINYMTTGTIVSSTTRKIFSIKVELVPSCFHDFLGEHVKIEICGSGFLKSMIRLMVGVIMKYAISELELSDITDSLKCKSDRKLAAVMPAKGLYKSAVVY